jgi:hypothetical protein
MHVLDWVESPGFLPALRQLIEPTGLQIAENAARQPKGRSDSRESVLTGKEDPFLTNAQRSDLLQWWLKHPHGAKLPTWDLAVSASTMADAKALVLVEAKAHRTEFSDAGKEVAKRKTEDGQARTDANHARIGEAIRQASQALSAEHSDVRLSRDERYQFCNRAAFAWKLASMGISVALLYLGFVGDSAIAQPGDCFAAEHDWQGCFDQHTRKRFPKQCVGKKIDCGLASFWLLPRSLPIMRVSPGIEQRRNL